MDDNPMNDEFQPELTEQQDRPRAARYGGWIGGAVLIVIGLVFLFQNLTGFSLENWWALFILIPAIGAFSNAWRNYQDAGGRMTSRVRGAMIGGFILLLVAAMFLFNLNWVIFGPLMLILVGVGLLLNALIPG